MFAIATIAVICAVLLGIFRYHHLWPKAQCWLAVGIGLGAAGFLGTILNSIGGAIASGIGTATSTVFGASVPWAIAIFVCVMFGIAVSKVGRAPNVMTLILGLFVPITLVMLPGVAGQGANTLVTAVGNSLTNLISMVV